jgi:hypothetical protein
LRIAPTVPHNMMTSLVADFAVIFLFLGVFFFILEILFLPSIPDTSYLVLVNTELTGFCVIVATNSLKHINCSAHSTNNCNTFPFRHIRHTRFPQQIFPCVLSSLLRQLVYSTFLSYPRRVSDTTVSLLCFEFVTAETCFLNRSLVMDIFT